MPNVFDNGGMIGTELSFGDQPVLSSLVYVGGATQVNTGVATDLSVSLTSLTGGTNTSPQAGDMVIIVLAMSGTATKTYRIAGYTPLCNFYSNSTYDSVLQMGYKFMGSTPDSTATITGGSGSTADGIAIAVQVWRNVDPDAPFDGRVFNSSATNTAIPDPPSCAPFTNGSRIIVAAGAAHAAGTGTFTASYLSNFLTAGTNSTNDCTVGMGHVAWTSGVYDPAAWTFSLTNATSYSYNSITFAIRPVAKTSGIWSIDTVFDSPYRPWASNENKFRNGGNPIDMGYWATFATAATLTRDTAVTDAPLGGVPLRMSVTGNDPYINTYSDYIWNLAPAANGQTWIVKVYAKASVDTVGQIFIFGADSTGAYLTDFGTGFGAGGFVIGTTWSEVSYTFTFANPNVTAIQTRVDGPDSGGTGVNIWWSGLQVYRLS